MHERSVPSLRSMLIFNIPAMLDNDRNGQFLEDHIHALCIDWNMVLCRSCRDSCYIPDSDGGGFVRDETSRPHTKGCGHCRLADDRPVPFPVWVNQADSRLGFLGTPLLPHSHSRSMFNVQRSTLKGCPVSTVSRFYGELFPHKVNLLHTLYLRGVLLFYFTAHVKTPPLSMPADHTMVDLTASISSDSLR